MTRSLQVLIRVLHAMVLALGVAAVPAMANPAGPHLDGNDYDALRPANPVRTVEFTMDVGCQDRSGQSLVLPGSGLLFGFDQEVAQAHGLEGRSQVTLGPDFVLARGRYGTAIHDFRFRRILTIGANEKRFYNHSMYGHHGVRRAFLFNHLYVVGLIAATGGKTSSSFPPAVQRFLVEHALGIFHPEAIAFKNHLPVAALNIDRQGEVLVTSVNNTEVLKAKYGTIGFPSSAHGLSFASWLAWFFPIHPKVAKVLVDRATLPASLQFIRSPISTVMGLPEFPVCSVVLSDISHASGRLDLLAGLASKIPAWPPILPEGLTRLMIDAVRLQAPNGPTANTVYLQRIRKLTAEKHYLDAALLSAHAMASTEPCSPARHDLILCDTVVKALQPTKSVGSVQTLRKALSVSSQGKHGQAAEMLISLRDRSPDRPDILEFMIANEVVEARRHSRRNKSELDESLRKEFDGLPHTFEAALGLDPYSPARFRDMSNYVSVAPRSTTQAYLAPIFVTVILDLGRALPDGRLSHFFRNPTARERKVADDFPDLFPKVIDPAE